MQFHIFIFRSVVKYKFSFMFDKFSKQISTTYISYIQYCVHCVITDLFSVAFPEVSSIFRGLRTENVKRCTDCTLNHKYKLISLENRKEISLPLLA